MRKEPLKEEPCDIKKWDEGNLGYSSNPYQYVPYFFNRYRVPMHLENSFYNEDVFIFASGSSTKNLDYELLRKSNAIFFAINNSAVKLLIEGIIPHFWIGCDDSSHFVKEIWENPRIMKFAPFGVVDYPLWDNENWKPLNKRVYECTNTYFFRRNEKFHAPRWFKESSINWGLHKEIGDCRSTLIACLKICFLLGFRRVYLLGVDFNMEKDNAYSFNEKRKDSDVKSNNRNYNVMAEDILPKIKEFGYDESFHIYNCNNNSRLNVFDKIDYKNALNLKYRYKSTIQTAGMYNSYKDKNSLTREDSIIKAGGK